MNKEVVLAGMSDEVRGWLSDGIETLAIRTVDTLSEARAAMAAGPGGVLVVSSRLMDTASPADLAAIAQVPTICCLEAADPGGSGLRNGEAVGVEALLPHPLDRVELVAHVTRLLGIRKGNPTVGAEETVALAPVVVWNEYRDAVFADVASLEHAGVALLAGKLEEEARRGAEETARALGDSLGTYGFPEDSSIARECEQILAGTAAVEPREILRFTELVVRLRADLEKGEPGERRRSERGGRAPTLLVIDADRTFAERILSVAAARGVRAIALDNPGQAGERLIGLRPEVVILDVSAEAPRTKLPLLELLGAVEPPIPAIVIGGGRFARGARHRGANGCAIVSEEADRAGQGGGRSRAGIARPSPPAGSNPHRRGGSRYGRGARGGDRAGRARGGEARGPAPDAHPSRRPGLRSSHPGPRHDEPRRFGPVYRAPERSAMAGPAHSHRGASER